MNHTISHTIADQIGHRALYMIGAKNLVGGENYLSMKVMRNNSGANHIKITLNSLDLYDMEFISVRARQMKVKKTVNNVYCDQLCSVIESETGLATKL